MSSLFFNLRGPPLSLIHPWQFSWYIFFERKILNLPQKETHSPFLKEWRHLETGLFVHLLNQKELLMTNQGLLLCMRGSMKQGADLLVSGGTQLRRGWCNVEWVVLCCFYWCLQRWKIEKSWGSCRTRWKENISGGNEEQSDSTHSEIGAWSVKVLESECLNMTRVALKTCKGTVVWDTWIILLNNMVMCV